MIYGTSEALLTKKLLREKLLNLFDDFDKHAYFGLGVEKIKTGAGSDKVKNWG